MSTGHSQAYAHAAEHGPVHQLYVCAVLPNIAPRHLSYPLPLQTATQSSHAARQTRCRQTLRRLSAPSVHFLIKHVCRTGVRWWHWMAQTSTRSPLRR